MRNRVLLSFAITVSAPFLAPAPTFSQSGSSTNNRPVPLAGVENGRVPADRLITVMPGCRAAREAGPSLALLFRQAAAAGVDLDVADCYRVVEDQVAISANQRVNGGPCTATPSLYPDGRVRGTSNHGWGKAVDFSAGRAAMTFTSAGYRFLEAHAGRLGWNHPGWAEPGTKCPEPWHWEWVGDGGLDRATPIRADVVSLLRARDDQGYATVTGLGKVMARGSAATYGDASGLALNWVIVGAAPTASGSGYWLLGADGGIFAFGDAGFYGSTGAMKLNRPVAAMAAAPRGRGYWLVAGDGGIFAFGDARFFGGTGAISLNKPIVGMASTPSGLGYWLVASDGGIFAFGDARFFGSGADRVLAQPVVALERTSSGDGYWMVTAGGTVLNRGRAGAFGNG